MNKLAVTAIGVAAFAAAGLWWWQSTGDPAPAPPAPQQPPAPAAEVAAGAPPANPAPTWRVATHVRRLANPGEQRRQLADRMAAASAARAARASSGGSGATSPAMATPARVLDAATAALHDVNQYVAECIDRPGGVPDLPGFKAALQLTGDPDVATLIDAPALSTFDDLPLPAPLDACLRSLLLSLELPPIATGRGFAINYEFTFEGDGDGSPDQPAPTRPR
jgi:hypothetical protein